MNSKQYDEAIAAVLLVLGAVCVGYLLGMWFVMAL